MTTESVTKFRFRRSRTAGYRPSTLLDGEVFLQLADLKWIISNNGTQIDVPFTSLGGPGGASYTLPAATAGALGGIKTGAPGAGKFVIGFDTDGTALYAAPAGGTGGLTSVNTKTGPAVTLTGSDISASSIDSTTIAAVLQDKVGTSAFTAAIADKANRSTANTFTAAQTLSYTYPGWAFNYAGVGLKVIALNAQNELEISTTGGTKLFRFTNGGRFWSAEWAEGFVHDRIEARCAAYANQRQAQLTGVPIKGGRWMYSGDYTANQMAASYPGGGEPFAGGLMSGFAASGGYVTVGRFRYLQLLNDQGSYITIGYGN
ncbi:hypothetical protein [uncultured Methylobacterium sp.]|uniref:hypothetical protein n=1 Tax=uncultured Methylobacterium sp. TaxID=157278 RepID=UPI0035CAAFA2